MANKAKKLPVLLYVFHDVDSGVMIASDHMRDIEHGEPVGVYKLEEVRRKVVDHKLVDAGTKR